MRIVVLALLLASVSALLAQGQQQTLQGLPEYGVLLTGSPELPVIVNHSGRSIIGFSMTTYMVDGGKGPGASLVLLHSRAAAIADEAEYQAPGATNIPKTVPIPPGTKGSLAFAISPSPIVKAVLDGVLFNDGEYVGGDKLFFETAPRRLDTYREVGKQLTAVKYGSDAEIAAVWTKFEEMIPDPDRNSAVLNLLQERDLHGERLAFDLAEYYSSLPVPWRLTLACARLDDFRDGHHLRFLGDGYVQHHVHHFVDHGVELVLRDVYAIEAAREIHILVTA